MSCGCAMKGKKDTPCTMKPKGTKPTAKPYGKKK
jgi:hypothetical protein